MARTLLSVLASLVLVIGAFPTHAAEPMRYIHPPPESATDRRYDYYWDLLKAALEATSKTHGAFELAAFGQPMNSKRALETLTKGEEITLMLTTASAEREAALLPVRIPLDKGLTGYRLFLINSESQPKLDKVKTIEELKQFKMGQSSTWVDLKILSSAGLTVEPGGNYKDLFRMLEGGRFELFPRGVNEISSELLSGQTSFAKLAIEKNLMVYYPLPRYFFFTRNPQGEALAKRVDDGLRIMLKNGEFDRRYQAFKKQTLEGLNLSGRRLFRIPNPLLSPETPLNQTDLWDSLSKEIKG